jgi:hypothetical protein
MYSKEQISTRLKLGSTLSTAELTLVVRSLFDKFEELENQINNLKNEQNEQLSTDRRGTDINTGKTIQTTPIQSGFKL